MKGLFTQKFFKFLSGFLLIIILTLLIIAGMQMIKTQPAQDTPTSMTATTTQ